MKRMTWYSEGRGSPRDASVIMIGVPDESGSRSSRPGCAQGPDAIRRVVAEREMFGEGRPALPSRGSRHHDTWDFGNVTKSQVSKTIRNFLLRRKFPIVLGGDHSITTQVLKGYPRDADISLVYFDAHPDIVYATRPYYGSVVADVAGFNVNLKKSVEIGIRQPEREELDHINEHGLLTIAPVDIIEMGIKETWRLIENRISGAVYVSIDMDVVDPAFAPGVGTPAPGGLISTEIMYLLKKLATRGLVGMDVMETNPPWDIQDMTAHLAARFIIETLATLRIMHIR